MILRERNKIKTVDPVSFRSCSLIETSHWQRMFLTQVSRRRGDDFSKRGCCCEVMMEIAATATNGGSLDEKQPQWGPLPRSSLLCHFFLTFFWFSWERETKQTLRWSWQHQPTWQECKTMHWCLLVEVKSGRRRRQKRRALAKDKRRVTFFDEDLCWFYPNFLLTDAWNHVLNHSVVLGLGIWNDGLLWEP